MSYPIPTAVQLVQGATAGNPSSPVRGTATPPSQRQAQDKTGGVSRR